MTVIVVVKELTPVSFGAKVKIYSKVPIDDESIVHRAFSNRVPMGQLIDEPTFTDDDVC